MSRTTDESSRARARELYAMNVSTPVIAGQLGVDRRTVSRWVQGAQRSRGPQPRPDLHDEKILELKNEGLSYAAIGRRLGVPWTTVRNRWYVINGWTRPGREKAVPGGT